MTVHSGPLEANNISCLCARLQKHPCNFLLAGQTRWWGRRLSEITISSFISLCRPSASLAECFRGLTGQRQGRLWSIAALRGYCLRHPSFLYTFFCLLFFTSLPLWHRPSRDPYVTAHFLREHKKILLTFRFLRRPRCCFHLCLSRLRNVVTIEG